MAADTASHYSEIWGNLWARRHRLKDRCAELEAELSEVKNEINHLNEILGHLSPLTGNPDVPGDITGLGITDAIRQVVSNTDGRMSASEIRRELENKGFDFSNYSQPMASVYKILSRLRDTKEVEIEREGTNVFYKRGPSMMGQIADEDIPF